MKKNYYLLLGLTLGAVLIGGCTVSLVSKNYESALKDSSAIFEDSINFRIMEITDKKKLDGPHLFLIVSTNKEYSCSNYGIEGSVDISGNIIKVVLGDITKPDMCLTAMGPAKFIEELDLKEGKYTLEFHLKSGVDKYNIVVTKEEISIKKIKATLSKPEQTRIYRTPENLISVKCFRYRYGCEKKGDIINELCPIFFAEIEKVATPADRSLLDKGILGGYCIKEDFDKGECKFYYYTGNIESLESIFEASNNYNLRRGYEAECRDLNLYYKRIDTWLGHLFCC
jgi:hypothetical protein